MVIMLPMHTDNGARLAAVLPSALTILTDQAETSGHAHLDTVIVVVVDGLGWRNLGERKGHARTIARMNGGMIRTVMPSTTGAALTSLTTGVLPGAHGLAGYRILHPQLGMRTTLTDWSGIEDVRSWQLHDTVFERAAEQGVSSTVIGRSAHATSGLTRAMLTGAQYRAADTIEARFEQALHEAGKPGKKLIYLYVDELDRAGHQHGWRGSEWIMRLEQLDAQVGELLGRLPAATGVILTADHGMIDIDGGDHTVMELGSELMRGVAQVGGEPRLRYLYLDGSVPVEELRERLSAAWGRRARVLTRDEAIDTGMFGQVSPPVIPRIGDLVVIAQRFTAFYASSDPESSRNMVGQHGSLSDQEREIPLVTAGAIDHAAFLRLVSAHAEALQG